MAFAAWVTTSVAKGRISASSARACIESIRVFVSLANMRDSDAKLARAESALAEMRLLKTSPPE